MIRQAVYITARCLGSQFTIYVSYIHIIHRTTQAGLYISDFALTRLENLYHFSNLRDAVQSNAIWHGRNMAALVLNWRLARSGHCHVCGLITLVI